MGKPARYTVFYDFYQIYRDDQSDDAEPDDQGELSYESSHSPWGVLWQIATATGWSVHYILWRVNYQTLMMMLADAPRYLSKSEREKKDKARTKGKSLSQLIAERSKPQ